MTERDLSDYPVLHLVRGWEYYHDKLLAPEDFSANAPVPDEYIFIGQYGGFDSGNLALSPHGSASYRLVIELPADTRSYTLELTEIFSSYRLYVNGALVAQMGNPTPAAYRPETGNRTVTFEAGERTELLFAVSDFTGFYSGMVYPPAFGNPHAVSRLLAAKLIFRAALCFIALAIGILSIFIGLLNKRHTTTLLYCLLCFFTVGYTCYPITQTLFGGTPLTYALERISFCAFLTLVMALQRKTNPSHGKRDIGKLFILTGVLACAVAYLSPFIAAGGKLSVMLLYSKIMSAFEWLTAGYITYAAARAAAKSSARSVAILCGALILDCALVMDRALPLYEPIATGWLPELASFAMVLCIGVSIGQEVAEQYRARAVLDERMSGMERLNRLQLEHYRNLEHEIETSKRMRHDMRHHFVMMDGLIKKYDYEGLEKYIAGFGAFVSQNERLDYCENRVINTLLSHFASLAMQNDILFEASCHVGEELAISDADLCCILSNLLENAVEACLRMEQGNRFIHIGVTSEAGLLAIRTKNSTVKRIDLHGSLSSKPGTGHGYGLESVKTAAERYGGSANFSWNEAEHVFTCDLTLR